MTRDELEALTDTELSVLIHAAQAEAYRRTLTRWKEAHRPWWKRLAGMW